MKKLRFVIPILLIGLAVLPQVALAVGLEEKTIVAEGKRIYLVKPGDSLSKIAEDLFGDPMRWKEIWKINPQITDPEMIFPGDALVIIEGIPTEEELGVREKLAAQPIESAPAPIPMEADVKPVKMEPPVVFEPVDYKEAPGLPASIFETCGYISKNIPEAAIIGSTEEKNKLSRFETVFINRGDKDGLIIGQEFQIIRPVREIFHPVSGNSMGWLMRILGRIRVDCLQEGTATAEIIVSYDYVIRGDRLEPYHPAALPASRHLSPKLNGPCLPAGGGVEGLILASRDGNTRIAEGDIVYLDHGLSSGIAAGTKFAVYRTGEGDAGMVARYLVGDLQVLGSQAYTSTALVTNSLNPITLADKVTTW